MKAKSTKKAIPSLSHLQLNKPLVLVVWSDTMGQPGWGHKQAELERGDDHICRSIGIMVVNMSTHIALALSECAYSYGDTIRIPRHAIRAIVELKQGKRWA